VLVMAALVAAARRPPSWSVS